MQTKTFRGLLRPGLLALGLALPVGTATADGSLSSRRVSLSTVPTAPGGTLGFRARTPHPGSTVVFYLGAGPKITPLAGMAPLLVGGPLLVTTAMPGPDGIAITFQSIPADSDPFAAYCQAFVVTPSGEVLASNTVEIEVGKPAVPLATANATVTLDESTSRFPASDVDWGDFDLDGRPDAFVASGVPRAVPSLLMNRVLDGLVDQAEERLPAIAMTSISVVEVGDVDNDGDDDLFLATGVDVSDPAPNLLLLNDGSGHFRRSLGLPPGKGLPLDAEFADVDGDGDLDLFVANRPDPYYGFEVPNGTTLYVNQGGAQAGTLGELVESAALGTIGTNDPHYSGGDISVGDLDNDGDVDLFIGRSSDQETNLVYTNDGSGAFTDTTAASMPAIFSTTFESVIADFDGDGWQDVWCSNSDLSQTSSGNLLLNLAVGGGLPLLVDASANVPASLGSAAGIRTACEVADIDSDGDLDILVGVHEFFDPFGPPGSTAGETVLLLNQGGAQAGVQGEFLVDPGFGSFGPFIDADVSVADVDVDGDLDVYVANGGSFLGTSPPRDVLIRNTRREGTPEKRRAARAGIDVAGGFAAPLDN